MWGVNTHPYLLLPFELIGLYANPMDLLIHFLDFLGPFTFYLPLIILVGFTTSFIGLSRPICFFFATYYFLWACWLLFLLFRPAGLYFTIFSSYLLHIVELLLPLDLLSKVGINNWLSRHIVYNFIYEWV